jgi:hypothetical protein
MEYTDFGALDSYSCLLHRRVGLEEVVEMDWILICAMMLVGPDWGPTTAGAAGAAAAILGYAVIIGPTMAVVAYLVRRRKKGK